MSATMLLLNVINTSFPKLYFLCFFDKVMYDKEFKTKV